MPDIILASNAYHRAAANLPQSRVVNRYLEHGPQGLVYMLPRPGAVLFATVGLGPIRGFFCKSGVLGRDYLVVSGSELYRVTIGGTATLVGSIAGDAFVEIDSDGTNTFLVAGTVYLYDGTTLSTVATPGGVEMTSIRQINSYFLLQVGSSGVFFFIEPGVTTIDALDFATAERSPDNGVCIRLLGDFALLLQTDGAEVWDPTGDADAPFQRRQGVVYQKGCAERETAIEFDNAVVCVSEDGDAGRRVFRFGAQQPERISVHGIEEALRLSTGFSAFRMTYDGHEFYVLRCEGQGTFAYDAAYPSWYEFASYGETCWLPQSSASASGGPLLLGSSADGKLYTLDADTGQDDGGPIQRVVTGYIPQPFGRGPIGPIRLNATVGWSPSLSLTPKVNMRLAKDGFTFTDPKERNFGARGDYRHRTMWERNGENRSPGCVVEFSDSDNAQVTLLGAKYGNDAT